MTNNISTLRLTQKHELPKAALKKSIVKTLITPPIGFYDLPESGYRMGRSSDDDEKTAKTKSSGDTVRLEVPLNPDDDDPDRAKYYMYIRKIDIGCSPEEYVLCPRN